jgi:hypothetical protein
VLETILERDGAVEMRRRYDRTSDRWSGLDHVGWPRFLDPAGSPAPSAPAIFRNSAPIANPPRPNGAARPKRPGAPSRRNIALPHRHGPLRLGELLSTWRRTCWHILQQRHRYHPICGKVGVPSSCRKEGRSSKKQARIVGSGEAPFSLGFARAGIRCIGATAVQAYRERRLSRQSLGPARAYFIQTPSGARTYGLSMRVRLRGFHFSRLMNRGGVPSENNGGARRRRRSAEISREIRPSCAGGAA